MNNTQKKQWDNYACMSRALIKASESIGNKITEDQFCAVYGKYFPNPLKQYGGLFLSRFYGVGMEMGLCKDIDIAFEADQAVELRKKYLVFVISAVHLYPKRSDPYGHTSFITKVNQDSFELDGFIDLPFADWGQKRCLAIVFYP